MSCFLSRISSSPCRRISVFAILAITLSGLMTPVWGESVYKNETFGFSIRVPVPEKAEISGPYQLITMPLPSENGFSANVNVQIQPFTGSAEEYLKISQEGLKSMGVKIITEKTGQGWLLLEAEGEVQGFPLHFYSKAWITKERTYLVTATCLQMEWEAKKGELTKCVESLTFN